jgi:hypothetical protein
VIGSTEWKAAGTNSEEEQAPLDVAATSGEELLPASATSGGSTSTAEDQDNAAPTSASEPGDQTNFLPQPQLGQVADRERERKVHLWFPRNVGQRSLEDLKRLRSGKWISISVAGADRRVWHGSLTPAVQDVMRRHDGEMVTLDREAPS